MDMPTEGVVAGTSMLKLLFAPLIAAAIAIALGFTYLWPETKREGFQRMCVALVTSFVFGPAIVIALHSKWPDLFITAKALALEYTGDASFGIISIATPVLVLPALASWWIFGGIVIWFQKRKGKDVQEIAVDMVNGIKEIRS